MPPRKRRARVLIVDDHPLVREGLTARISSQPDMVVCGEAEDVDAALAELESKDPDVMIVDLSLRSGHGLSLLKMAGDRYPGTRTLVFSAHEESVFAERSLRAGACGFVSKQESRDKIIEALRTVLRGERYLSRETAQRLIGQALDKRAVEGGVSGLSDRELEVFEAIGRGKSTRAIADELDLSVHTIETHRENIRAKLQLHSGTELVKHAVQWVLESQ